MAGQCVVFFCLLILFHPVIANTKLYGGKISVTLRFHKSTTGIVSRRMERRLIPKCRLPPSFLLKKPLSDITAKLPSRDIILHSTQQCSECLLFLAQRPITVRQLTASLQIVFYPAFSFFQKVVKTWIASIYSP